jgi:hypothetical protein
MPRESIRGTSLSTIPNGRCSWGVSLMSNTVVTVTSWIKMRANSSSSFDVILGYGTARWYIILIGGTTRPFFAIRASGVEKTSSALTNSMTLNSWFFLTATYDPSGGSNNITLRMYDETGTLVEGVAATVTGSMDTTSNALACGQDPTRGLSVTARYKNVRIYGRILSTTEQDNLALNILPSRANLILETYFNDGSGTTAVDTSGSNLTATLSSNATFNPDVPALTVRNRNLSTGRVKVSGRVLNT